MSQAIARAEKIKEEKRSRFTLKNQDREKKFKINNSMNLQKELKQLFYSFFNIIL